MFNIKILLLIVVYAKRIKRPFFLFFRMINWTRLRFRAIIFYCRVLSSKSARRVSDLFPFNTRPRIILSDDFFRTRLRHRVCFSRTVLRCFSGTKSCTLPFCFRPRTQRHRRKFIRCRDRNCINECTYICASKPELS